jgi:hypothetical protein
MGEFKDRLMELQKQEKDYLTRQMCGLWTIVNDMNRKVDILFDNAGLSQSRIVE